MQPEPSRRSAVVLPCAQGQTELDASLLDSFLPIISVCTTSQLSDPHCEPPFYSRHPLKCPPLVDSDGIGSVPMCARYLTSCVSLAPPRNPTHTAHSLTNTWLNSGPVDCQVPHSNTTLLLPGSNSARSYQEQADYSA